MNKKQFSMLLLAASLSTAVFAQKEEKTIIINDGKKSETLNVQVDGDKVTINGIPANKWKDEDLEKLSHKKIKVKVHGKNGMEFSMPDFEIETEFKNGNKKEVDIKSFKMDGGDFNFHMPKMPEFEKSFPFEYHNNNGGGKVKLGIEIQDLEEGNGVKVTDVDNEMAAGKSGLKEDDIITDFNGKEVKSVDDLRAKLKELKEGEAFKLGVKRNGKSQTIDIKYPKKLKTANLQP
jgi:membrane-associated protease RseP (regulator of RpoE activity)